MAIPHYPDVPAEWKHPFGPYRQAPAEFGGEWWFVNPFYGPEPWKTDVVPDASPEFVKVFGPAPKRNDPFYQEWFDNKKHFKGIKLPEYISQAELDLANETYRAWSLGDAVIYEGRYGFSARWPESGEYDFDWDARGAVMNVHQVVATFQIKAYQEGKTPAKWHPFVPPAIYGGENPKT